SPSSLVPAGIPTRERGAARRRAHADPCARAAGAARTSSDMIRNRAGARAARVRFWDRSIPRNADRRARRSCTSWLFSQPELLQQPAHAHLLIDQRRAADAERARRIPLRALLDE